MGGRWFPVAIFLVSLFTTSFAQDLSFGDGFEEFKKYVKDHEKDADSEFFASGLNPPLHPSKWVTLGDSFAAGPGAGDTVQDNEPQCVRGSEAYGYQMQNANDMPGPAIGEKPEHTFKACTGDVTTDLTDTNNPNFQLAAVSDFTTFVTLSIGGNDITFSTILKKCVYGLPITGPSCDDTIDNARKILYGTDFHSNYEKVISTTLDKMKWEDRRNEWRTAIFQTGYSQFFDAYTEQCNNVGFLLVGDLGPKITQELRIKLNRLTHEVNFVEQYWIDLINTRKTKSSNFNIYTTPINYVNVDPFYNNHRFCREGVTEPDAVNIDTHFFHLLGDPHEHTQDEWIAEMDKYDDPDATNRPVAVTKSFHPTPPGFTSTKDLVLYRLQYQDAARYLANRAQRFQLLVLGDYVAYAKQDPNDNIYQGFIPHLDAIFRDYHYYGYPYGSGLKVVKPTFIGSRRPVNGNGRRHECYQHATIDELREKFSQSSYRDRQNKVVALLAGYIDVLYGIDLENAPSRVMALLDNILEADRTATILLAQLPLPGTPDMADGTTWYQLQRNFVDFNARLAAIANEYVTRKKGRVYVVHTSTTPLEHDADPLLPNQAGYYRMAHDFAEAIVQAGAQGLVTESEEPPTNEDQAAYDDVDKIQCVAPRGFINGQPSKEDLLDSYLQGKTVDEFIDQIACNKTQICRISADGVHGDMAFLDLNATMCFHAGGKAGKPDYNQLNVTMPKPDYDLTGSACGKQVKAIIDECISSDKASGGWWKGQDGLFIMLGPEKVPGNSNEVQDFEADYFENDAAMALIKDNVPLPNPPSGPSSSASQLPPQSSVLPSGSTAPTQAPSSEPTAPPDSSQTPVPPASSESPAPSQEPTSTPQARRWVA